MSKIWEVTGISGIFDGGLVRAMIVVNKRTRNESLELEGSKVLVGAGFVAFPKWEKKSVPLLEIVELRLPPTAACDSDSGISRNSLSYKSSFKSYTSGYKTME